MDTDNGRAPSGQALLAPLPEPASGLGRSGDDPSREALASIRALCDRFEPTGSRVICSPPPTDTDEDFLVLVSEENARALGNLLSVQEWGRDGSEIPDEVNEIEEGSRFISYKLGSVNLIITRSPVFFERFMQATAEAKALNLLKKADRIALFQKILYGREPLPKVDLPALEEEIAF